MNRAQRILRLFAQLLAVSATVIVAPGAHGQSRDAVQAVETARPVASDVRYAGPSGSDLQKLDVYNAHGLKNAPVVVYVHGGSWMAGNRRNVRGLPGFFNANGMVFVSVGYRLSPAAMHPAFAEDVAAAVAWVRRRIVEHGGDPDRIYLMGHSAGAHLVSLVGTDPSFLTTAGAGPNPIAGVIAMDSAAMDLREILARDTRADSPYRAAFGADPKVWAAASPIVHAGLAPGEDRQPPFQIVVAYGPGLEGKKRGVDAFASALRESKTRAEVLDVSALRDHQSLMTEFGMRDDPVAAAVLAFIRSSGEDALRGLGQQTVLQATGPAAERAAAQRTDYRRRVLMRQFDRDNDGRITRDEMAANPFIFNRMDADRDGVVTADELAAFDSARGDDTNQRELDAWAPMDAPLGDDRVSYRDPEVLQQAALMTFADAEGTVWIARLDPADGTLVSRDGRESRIDGPISPWSRYSNGPEWGLDKDGPAVFYLKDDERSAGQIWRAEPPWDAPRLTQMTSSATDHHWLAGASVDATLGSTRLIAYVGQPRGRENYTAWIDESAPGTLHRFTQRMNLARWAFNAPAITWSPRTAETQTRATQVTLVDTVAGTTSVITDDEGVKTDPWLWEAPEFAGERLLAVNIDRSALGIYRRSGDAAAWSRIAMITLPADAPHHTLKSIEPVNGGRGAFGRSYFTVQAGDDADSDTSIWLFGFDAAGRHLVRRLDDGGVTDQSARRLDPESLVGRDELIVYYTRLVPGRSELRRCRTGVTAASDPSTHKEVK